ncbi:MAG: mechanosensitive ion channel family protein [Gammaproteobacteria bacterium]|nr:mechanosensitive ion channel family protein [Gammaproteobacteria bacterium]MDE2251472.1 mechanosensitive ion channel family protein [Gammaproteobacteria bacterium]
MSANPSILNPRLWDESVVMLARVAGTLVLAWLAQGLTGRLLRAFRSRIAPHITDAEDARRAETLARVSRHMARVIIWLVAGMLVLSELGISVTPILGAAGVVGLAVGFGAQSLVKDYVSGFFLLLENQITKGDVVEIAGKSGEVEDVTLRYVQLRDYGGNVHFVPNGMITTVTNMSRGFAYAVVEVGVAPGAMLERVYLALRTVAQGLRADPAFADAIDGALEISGVDRLDGTAVIVRSRLRVRPLEQWRVRWAFLQRLKEEFERHGVELPPPQLTVASR